MEHTIDTEIEIIAPIESVFDAWTNPEETTAWWSTDGYTIHKWESDPQPGGNWRSEGLDAKGDPFVHQGEYLTVDRPTALSFTWQTDKFPARTVVELELSETEKGTRLKLRHSGFENEEAKTGHEKGWGIALGWLRGYLESPH